MTGQTGIPLESVFEHVTDAILIIDREGYLQQANKAAERLTGRSRDELCSGNVCLCDICGGMATCSAETSCAECFIQHSSIPSFELVLRTADRGKVPVAASSSRLPDGERGAIVAILRDMSEQQRTERERMQRLAATNMIRAQEEERKRISRDLHDGVGQALYSILVGLRVVKNLAADPTCNDLLADVERQTLKAMDEIKTMALELRPAALDDLGLVPAIRSFAKRFERTFGIETRMDLGGLKRRLAPEVETALYRICQEAMLNAAKYAHSDVISVRLQAVKGAGTDAAGQVEMTVTDRGVGFHPELAASLGKGLGLYGMKERAHLLGGRVDIRSEIGTGTTVRVVIPVNEKGEAAHVDPGFDRR